MASLDMYKLGQLIGNAYGNLWTANASKRDDKKIEGIKDKLNQSPEDVNAALTVDGNTLDPNATYQDVANAIGDNALISGGPNGIQYNKKAGITQTIPDNVPNINKSAGTISMNDNGTVEVTPQATRPTGLGWRPNFSAIDLDRAMKAQGIGKASRDRALADYRTETAEQAQKEMLPDILDAIANGKNKDALGAILQYQKYDPATSNLLLKDYQTAMQFQRQKELQDIALANKLALQNNAAQNKILYHAATGGGDKTKTTKPEKMMTDESLQKQILTLQNEIDSLPSGSPAFMQKSAIRDKLAGELEALQTYGVEGQRKYNNAYKAERERIASTDYNLNKWDDAAELANEMIYRQGVSPKETLARLKIAGAPDWVISGLEGSYKDIL